MKLLEEIELLGCLFLSILFKFHYEATLLAPTEGNVGALVTYLLTIPRPRASFESFAPRFLP